MNHEPPPPGYRCLRCFDTKLVIEPSDELVEIDGTLFLRLDRVPCPECTVPKVVRK